MSNRCFGWFRWHKRFNTSATALQPLATLFAFFILQIIVAIVLEQDRGKRYRHLLEYIILGLLTLCVILSIVLTRKSRRGEAGYAYYCYDRATYLTGRCIFCICLFTLAIFAFCGWRGCLPGQELRPLVVSDVKVEDKLVNGLPGLGVDVLLSQRQFSGGMPLEVVLYVHRNSEPSKEWKAVYADVREIGPNGTSVPTLAEGTVRQNTDPIKVIVTGMVNQPSYIATISFTPKDPITRQIPSGLRTCKPRRALTKIATN